eukprot:XP_011670203.1 PREDICTED: uncharacterized protein LOC105441089 [Strongylocentrotus purpuratus]
MMSKLLCLLGFLSLLIQGREASIVPVVETIPEITVTFGEEGLLKCAYERKSFAVYWRFVSDSSYGDLLVALDQYYQVGERSGPGYDEGRFNMTNDFSLLIHDVTVKDEGRYICEVSDFETGVVFRNYTDVTVTVQAIRPLVRVQQCGSDNRVSVNATDNPKASCMIQNTPDQHHVQLDCFVEGAKPQIDMSWVDNTTLRDLLNGTSLIATKGKREGTVDQKLTVILEASAFQSNQEYYFTCIAEGQAIGGIASVTVGINKVPPGVSAGILAFVGLVVFVVLVLVILIPVLMWKKYKRTQHGQVTTSTITTTTSTTTTSITITTTTTTTIYTTTSNINTDNTTMITTTTTTTNTISTTTIITSTTTITTTTIIATTIQLLQILLLLLPLLTLS